jgi:hypothetical protein
MGVCGLRRALTPPKHDEVFGRVTTRHRKQLVEGRDGVWSGGGMTEKKK